MVSPRNNSRDRKYNRGQSNQPIGYSNQREMLLDNWQQVISTFEEMKLRPEILRGIRTLGYIKILQFIFVLRISILTNKFAYYK
jgi:hypothetical protein